MSQTREALLDCLRCAPDGLVEALRSAARRDGYAELLEAAAYELGVRAEMEAARADGMGCPLRDEPVEVARG